MSNLRLAIRTLGKRPGMSAVVILLLACGIGANTALFSLVEAVLLRTIPGVERPGDLVRFIRAQNGRSQSNQSYPDYIDIRDQAKTLDGLVAERLMSFRFAGPPAQLVSGAIVTENYFQVLGVRPTLGRMFGPEDGRTPGGHPMVVVSPEFWSRQFGSDPAIAGKSVNLNGQPFTVVGVAAPRFAGVALGESTAIWMPMMMVRYAMTRAPNYNFLGERRAGWLTFYGRLRRGVRLDAAQAELDVIAPRLDATRRFVIHGNADTSPGQRASLRNLLGLLFAAVAVVLLIVCGNVANLMLVWTQSRGREVSIRLALGASRAVIVKQLLLESLLLGFTGGVLGVLMAPWLLPLLRKVWSPDNLTAASAAAFNPRVLAFTLGASLLTVMLFGLAPAWSAGRTDVASALKSFAPQSGRRRGRLQWAWVVAQVALSAALVAGGSLVLRSMQNILAIDPGYRHDRIVMATMDLSLAGYSEERGQQFFAGLLDQVSRLPGVRSASLAKSSPAIDWSDRLDIGPVQADSNIVAPRYFQTLGIPLIAGRDFAASDRKGGQAVAIVSQSLARSLWPDEDPLGKLIPVNPPMQVVGVASDSRYRSILSAPPRLLYVPLPQRYDSIARLMVDVDGDASAFAATLRRAIQDAAPELPLQSIETMDRQIERSLWRQRAAASLLSFFGVLAIGLACAGIHGVLAHRVAQQTREIGIRMALGADRVAVVRKIVGQALRVTAAGLAIAVPLGFWAKPALATLLYGIGAIEPAVVVGVPMLFVAVAVAASFAPARRASGVDPAVALRQE